MVILISVMVSLILFVTAIFVFIAVARHEFKGRRHLGGARDIDVEPSESVPPMVVRHVMVAHEGTGALAGEQRLSLEASGVGRPELNDARDVLCFHWAFIVRVDGSSRRAVAETTWSGLACWPTIVYGMGSVGQSVLGMVAGVWAGSTFELQLELLMFVVTLSVTGMLWVGYLAILRSAVRQAWGELTPSG